MGLWNYVVLMEIHENISSNELTQDKLDRMITVLTDLLSDDCRCKYNVLDESLYKSYIEDFEKASSSVDKLFLKTNVRAIKCELDYLKRLDYILDDTVYSDIKEVIQYISTYFDPYLIKTDRDSISRIIDECHSLTKRTKSSEEILKTEYSERFDEIRKNMMVTSYYKYGSMKDNYEKFRCMDAIGNLEKRLAKYKETGNTEFLADIANFAMIEFMYPSIDGANYIPTESGSCDVVGFSVNDIKNFE